MPHYGCRFQVGAAFRVGHGSPWPTVFPSSQRGCISGQAQNFQRKLQHTSRP